MHQFFVFDPTVNRDAVLKEAGKRAAGEHHSRRPEDVIVHYHRADEQCHSGCVTMAGDTNGK